MREQELADDEASSNRSWVETVADWLRPYGEICKSIRDIAAVVGAAACVIATIVVLSAPYWQIIGLCLLILSSAFPLFVDALPHRSRTIPLEAAGFMLSFISPLFGVAGLFLMMSGYGQLSVATSQSQGEAFLVAIVGAAILINAWFSYRIATHLMFDAKVRRLERNVAATTMAALTALSAAYSLSRDLRFHVEMQEDDAKRFERKLASLAKAFNAVTEAEWIEDQKVNKIEHEFTTNLRHAVADQSGEA